MYILNISILIVLVLILILLISVVLANKKSEQIFLQILAGCILITVVVGIVWFLFSIERGYSIGLIVLFAIPFIKWIIN